MDSETDWEHMLGLVDALSNAIVKYYAENEVSDREVGLEAMIVLTHLTRTAISELDQDFDAFVARCVQKALEIQNARRAAKASDEDTTLKN